MPLVDQSRYNGLYDSTHQMRVGVSSPVSYNDRTKRYCGWIVRDNFGAMPWERPSQYDRRITLEAGQYGSGYPAVISE